MQVLLRQAGKPIYGQVLREIVSAQEVATLWPAGLAGEDDESWDWPTLVTDHPAGAWEHFELQAAGRTQGLMIVKREVEFRAPANTARSGGYIEYVAAAPWNRPPTGDTRFERLTPVGLVMIGTAIQLSVELGHEGRLAWHSKPGAESWYRANLPGLWSGGPDVSEDGFEYFELTGFAAREFLTRHQQLFVEA